MYIRKQYLLIRNLIYSLRIFVLNISNTYNLLSVDQAELKFLSKQRIVNTVYKNISIRLVHANKHCDWVG